MKYLDKEVSFIQKYEILSKYGQDKMREGIKNVLYDITEEVHNRAGNQSWLITFSKFTVKNVRE